MNDVLSDVFSQLRVSSVRLKRLEAGGAWALSFPGRPLLKFCAVLRGACWIRFPGQAPRRLLQGDAFLLAHNPPYVMASDHALAPADGLAAYDGGAASHCRVGGADTELVGVQFAFQPGMAEALVRLLPAFIHVARDDPSAAVLHGTLALLDAELQGEGIGKTLMTRRLADIALVQVLRAYMAGGAAGPGWLRALADPRIAKALSAIHGQPGRDWTVAELAAIAAMSRSSFALRFRELIGAPPLEYLLRWRMECASLALCQSREPVAAVAAAVGYASLSAFGHAFKRTFGCGPAQYRSRAAAAGQGGAALIDSAG